MDTHASGDHPLHFDLGAEARKAANPQLIRNSGRSGRTLVRSPGMSVTLLVVAPRGVIPEHSSEGPITVQPVAGEILFNVEGTDFTLETGELLYVPAGQRHSVTSRTGGTFLLTRWTGGRDG